MHYRKERLNRKKLLAFLKMSQGTPIGFQNIRLYFSGYGLEALRVMIGDLQQKGYVTKHGLKHHYEYSISSNGLKVLENTFAIEAFNENVRTEFAKLDNFLLMNGGLD